GKAARPFSAGLSLPPHARLLINPRPRAPIARHLLPLGALTMFRLNAAPTRPYCDGLSRRSFLSLGVAGMASVALPSILRARDASPTRKNTSCILIWLDGGPGHMDMYDMKPEAPREWAGIWKPIKTKVPGFDVTELYPRQARITNKFSMVRSLHHDTGDH